jgi:hypothetical protein
MRISISRQKVRTSGDRVRTLYADIPDVGWRGVGTLHEAWLPRMREEFRAQGVEIVLHSVFVRELEAQNAP